MGWIDLKDTGYPTSLLEMSRGPSFGKGLLLGGSVGQPNCQDARSSSSWKTRPSEAERSAASAIQSRLQVGSGIRPPIRLSPDVGQELSFEGLFGLAEFEWRGALGCSDVPSLAGFR